MPACIWPDGTFHEAASWGKLLETIREHPWNAIYSDEEFRRVLAKRAYIWSTTIVDPTTSDEEFFSQLHDAGLIRIIDIARRPTS